MSDTPEGQKLLVAPKKDTADVSPRKGSAGKSHRRRKGSQGRASSPRSFRQKAKKNNSRGYQFHKRMKSPTRQMLDIQAQAHGRLSRKTVSFEANSKTNLRNLQVFDSPTYDSLYTKIENSRRQKSAFSPRKKRVHIRKHVLTNKKNNLKPVKTTVKEQVVVKDVKKEENKIIKELLEEQLDLSLVPPSQVTKEELLKPRMTQTAPVPMKPQFLDGIDDLQVPPLPYQENPMPLPPVMPSVPTLTEDNPVTLPPVILEKPPEKSKNEITKKPLDLESQSGSSTSSSNSGSYKEDPQEVVPTLEAKERLADDYGLKVLDKIDNGTKKITTSFKSLSPSAVGGEWPDDLSNGGAKEVVDGPNDEFEGSDDDSVEVNGSSFQNIRSKSLMNTALFAENLMTESLNIKYKREYLSKNTLEVLYEAFVGLDNTLNLFFHTYSGLKRSSYLCARIWIFVMKLRMLMQDSMSHLVDQPHFLSPGFRDSREAQIYAIRDAVRVVAGAVQYVVIYTKHTEKWKFHRRPFLVQLGYDIAESLRKSSEQWLNFEIFLYEMDGVVEKSYRAHVELEQLKIVRSLLQVQPNSKIGQNDDRYKQSLEQMLRDLKNVRKKCPEGNILGAVGDNKAMFDKRVMRVIERDFYMFRVQLSIVKDIQDMDKIYDFLPDMENEERDTSSWDAAVDFLRKQMEMQGLTHILEDDMTIWPHQMGLTQIGPFKLLTLYDAADYFEVNFSEGTYKYSDLNLPNMDFYAGLKGAFTIPAPVSFPNNKESRAIRNSLKIPETAVYYSYFHPLRYNEEHINKFEPESLAAIKQGIEDMNRVQSPLHAIVGVGGFAYFDEDYNLIRVNGLAMGEDIFFDGPYFLPSNEGFNIAKQAGVEMTVVTLKGLEATGAMNHGWLSNKEQLDSFRLDGREFFAGDGELRRFGGAFFYQYNNSEHPEWNEDRRREGGRRNFFQLISFRELTFQRAKNRNTLLLRKLEYEVSLKKRDWEVCDFDEVHSDVGDLEELIRTQKKRKNKGRCNIM